MRLSHHEQALAGGAAARGLNLIFILFCCAVAKQYIRGQKLAGIKMAAHGSLP
jgi:hypothetical protein